MKALCLVLFLWMVPALDLGRVVDCLAQTENGRPWGPGGALCWTKAAWQDETNLPYEYAVDYDVSRVLAISRLAKFSGRLKEEKIKPTPAILGDCWRWGYNGKRGTEYGQRVSNLYYDAKN